MKLSAPKNGTFLLAFILGALGIAGHFVAIPFVSANVFWLLMAGFVILSLGCLLNNF